MKIMCLLWIIVGSVALLHVGGGQAAAQIELGGAASVSNVRGGTFGLGGRIGVPVRESTNMGVRLEATVDYYWPSCSQADCDAIVTHLDVVFQNRVGGRADTYFGVGGTHQNVTLQQDDRTVAEGDFWGVNIVVGARYASQTAFRPFLEVRWTGLDNLNNQWAMAFGTTVALRR